MNSTRILQVMLLICSCNFAIGQVDLLPLNSNWEFKAYGDQNWIPINIPGTAHTGLIENKIIEDPYFADNEKKYSYLEEKDWVFQTSFNIDFDTYHKKHLYLIFEGLDTYCDVFLNDQKLLTSDNMFRSWKVDIKKQAKEFDNKLVIYFRNPSKVEQEKISAQGYELPGGSRVHTRKAQFHYGWDWGPRFLSAGIWKPVFLKAFDKACITDLNIQSNQVNDRAFIQLELEIEAEKRAIYDVVFDIDNERYCYPVDVKKGINKRVFELQIFNPKLWWSNGLGSQNLYNIKTSIGTKSEILDRRKDKFGIRNIKLVTVPDEKGETFYFTLNGEPVFMKGANYIPQDYFHTRVTKEDHRALLQSVLDANMNMIRVWGGGIYESDSFYELCDEMGILVWQDFMFACAMYPGDQDFIKSVEEEAIQNVKRLSNHPSIAVWCGNNENSEGWHRWGWQAAFDKKQRKSIWSDYEKLFQKMLPAIVKDFGNGVDYWETSPKLGRGDPKHQFEGDSHYWGIWHDAEPFSNYENKVPRFMSEFGFQSFPSWETLLSFTTEKDRSLESDVMTVHQKHPRGNKLIKTYMERDYKVPADFEHFVYISQLLQAEGISTGIKAHRRAMPYCMGSLYWQLNDCWPVASWAGIDYYKRKKALHYFVKDAFEPILISPTIEKEELKVYIVSDEKELIVGQLDIKAWDFAGKFLFASNTDVEIAANKSLIYYTKPIKDLIGDHNKGDIYLELTLSTVEQKLAPSLFYFTSPKNLILSKPDIETSFEPTEGGIIIQLKTNCLAKNVQLNTKVSGEFDANFFDLTPRSMKKVFFKTSASIDEFASTFSIRSLFDTY